MELSPTGLHAPLRLAQPKAVSIEAAGVSTFAESATIWLALGQSLVARGHLEQSLLCFKAAHACAADDARVPAARGIVLFRLGRAEEAMADYLAALQLDPGDAETWINLGVLYHTSGFIEEGQSCFETALLHRPAAVEAWANRGKAQFALGDFAGAMESLLAAIAYKPGDARLVFDCAICLLALGNWAEGWRLYDARLKLNLEPRILTRCFPLWQGEPLAGKRVLVLSEQGLGDVFQFARFTHHLAAQGATVTLHVQAHLRPVLAGLLTDCDVIDHFEADAGFDYEVPLMSLPGRLSGDMGILADFSPYLAACDERVAQWRTRFEAQPARVRIGLSWQGNPNYAGDAARSLPLKAFAPLADCANVDLVSLQRITGVEQIPAVGFAIEVPGPDVDADGAFLDTAAIIATLDLVITSDTAVAHLAGAMGRPVWLLLAHVPDWRWAMSGSTTPWYPSMRLFRQAAPGDWAGVMADVTAAIEAEFSARRATSPTIRA